MNSTIAVFAYDFPHRKTHDFVLDLLSAGANNLVILAAPKKQLKMIDSRSYYSKSLRPCPALATEELCSNLDIPYYRVEHDDADRINELKLQHGFELAIIAGARIIKANVIEIFPKGVINFHPGKLPQTSGLDAFYYTIKHAVAAGVTSHYIDYRVDAGNEIRFDEVRLSASETPETLTENVYQLQRVALRRLLAELREGPVSTTPIDRPMKNQPMTPEEKVQALAGFSAWRARRYFEQKNAELFGACATGDASVAMQLLDSSPQLVFGTNDKGWSPLIVACFNQHIAIAKILLERGADPNDCGRKGTTVLMYAKTKSVNVKDADYELLDLLIASGADCLRTDCFGKTIMDYVRATGDSRMIAYFEGHTRRDNAIC